MGYDLEIKHMNDMKVKTNEINISPLFTIVVIAYNVENYISECLNSIINQTTKSLYEILVVNDGSTDRTKSIILEYAKKTNKIRLINKSNEGSGYARNTGIREAKGKWIMFVDGDDYIDEHTIESYELFAKKDIDVCLGRFSVFRDGSCKKPVPLAPKMTIDEIESCKDGRECFVYLHTKNGGVELGTKGLYRRDFLINNSIFMKSYKRGQDNDWAVRIYLNAKRMSYNQFPYYFYREGRNGSAVNSYSLDKALGVLKMETEWYEIANKESGDFGYALKEETVKCYWFFFKLYASSFKKHVLKEYCLRIDEARFLYQDFKDRLLWMKALDCFGSYKTIIVLKRTGIIKLEALLKILKKKLTNSNKVFKNITKQKNEGDNQ